MLASRSHQEISEALAQRAPADGLARAVRDLLKNYWQPDETPEEQARHVGLMVADLARFSAVALRWALREWRLTVPKRPSTADLVRLAGKRERELMARRDDLLAIERLASEPPRDRGDRAQREACMDRLLNEAGFRKIGGMITIPGQEGRA